VLKRGYSFQEALDYLGVKTRFFNAHIRPHVDGLVVTRDAGGRAHVDAATLPAAGAAIAAADGTDRHIAAGIYRLTAEATRLFAQWDKADPA
jgi:hypothetical protein